jgi:PAS domain S-box-containing protein
MVKNRSVFCFLFIIFMVDGAMVPSVADDDRLAMPGRRILESASELTYPPFSLIAEDGRVDGFSVDLLKAVARAVGLDVAFDVGPWHRIKQALIDGRIDVLPFVSYSKERDRVFDFTAPYLRLHGTIFVRKGETSILSETDLKDKEVLVMRGDTAHEYAVSRALSDHLILTDSFEEAMRLLSEGRHDAVIIQQLAGIQLVKLLKLGNIVDVDSFRDESLKPEGRPLRGFEQKFCIAVREGDKDLLAQLNEGLAIVIANGIYDDLYHQWFGPILPQPPVPPAVVVQYLLFILLPLLVLAGLVGIRFLKREVALKTRKLTDQIRITETAKMALKESETHLRTLIDTLPDLIWLKDPDGVYISCNARFEEFFGAKEKDIIGKTDYDFVNRELADFFRSKDNEAVSRGRPCTNEERIIFASDGHSEILETIKMPIYNHGGELNGILGIGRNITERKRAEDLLRYERDLFDRIMETSPAGILRLDAGGNLVYLNKRAETILGIRFSEARQRTFNDPAWKITDFYGTPLPAESLPFDIVRKTGKPVSDVRHAIEWPDGGQVFLSVNATPLFDASGVFDGMVAIIEDITEKYRAEQNYQILFREMLDGFALHEILCDDNGNPIDYRFLAINPAFENLTGFRGETLIGKTVLEVMPRTEFHWIERYGRVALTGEPDTFESYSQQLNRHFQVTAFRYAKHQFACIFTDVTERKSAEAERNRLVEAIEQAGEVIAITSPQGEIQYVNPAFEKITGYSRAHAVGKNPSFLKSGVQETPFYTRLWNTILSGNRWTGQIVNIRKNGEPYTSECSISPVKNEKGDITNFVWIAKDITSQIELEKRIIQAQKMESIGNLAGGIAHDFNNILFPILGMAEMLMEDLDPGGLEHENAREIYTAGKRGSELVKQILAFSRQNENEMTPVRVQQIMKEVLKLIRSIIPSNIEIGQFLQQDCGLVMADPTRIHQIAMNLLTNAYHAVEDAGGKIEVQVREIRPADHEMNDDSPIRGDYVMLSVSDTGCGIDPRVIHRIFEPYFTTKAQGKGTGLGLSVVYGIVKEHKGDIKVDSELGKGTTFTVYLPLMEKSAVSIPAGNPEILMTGTERILLVDDELPILRLGKQMLERLGYHVVVQTGSTEALETFRADPGAFDMVITDMSMPLMTGTRLAGELQRIRSDIPIILCTGFSQKITEPTMNALGIRGLLMKPIVRSEMARMIRNVLDTNATFRRSPKGLN